MKYSKEIKIGVFVVVILVVSFFTINYLRGKDVFNREIEVRSSYQDVRGLVASAPVSINGYKCGKVTEVNYRPDTRDFEVICSIRREFEMPVDSKMVIYSVDIMGGKGVKIELGQETALVENGAYLQPDMEGDLLGTLADNIGPLMGKVTDALDSLNVTIASVNAVLSQQNRASINRTLSNLEDAMASLKSVAGTIKAREGEIDSLISNLEELSSSLVNVAAKADTVVDNVNGVVATVESADLKGTIDSFHKLLDNINDPDGTVGKLLKDDSVYNSVDSLLVNIDDLIVKIKENPKKYLKISVF